MPEGCKRIAPKPSNLQHAHSAGVCGSEFEVLECIERVKPLICLYRAEKMTPDYPWHTDIDSKDFKASFAAHTTQKSS